MGETKLVINALLDEIKKDEELFRTYIGGIQDIQVLTRVFDKAKCVFDNKKREKRFGQMSWETFVKDARLLRFSSRISTSPKSPFQQSTSNRS